MHWGVTILPLNAIVSQRACNSPSLHVLYLGSKIVKNIFYYFWLDVQIYRGHPLTLISAMGGHYTTNKCNCSVPSVHVTLPVRMQLFPSVQQTTQRACNSLSQFACTLFRSKNRQKYILLFLVGCPNI